MQKLKKLAESEISVILLSESESRSEWRVASEFLGDVFGDNFVVQPEVEVFMGEKVDEVRNLNEKICGGGKRFVVIKNAEFLNVAAQNALLKLLEEPPRGTKFILCGGEFSLLPTIISRSVVLRLPPRGCGEVDWRVKEKSEESEEFAKNLGGLKSLAAEWAGSGKFERILMTDNLAKNEDLAVFVQILRSGFAKSAGSLGATREAERRLKSNVNKKLVLDILAAEF